MNIKSNFLTFLLGAIALSSSAAFGQTETTQTQFSLYGMHSISNGQTARISVQNACLSDPASIIPCISPDPDMQPCIRVRIVFDVYEAAGDGSVRLRFARRVSREVDLDGGEAAAFDFPASRGGDWISPSVSARCMENCPVDRRQARVLSTLAIRQGGSTVLLLPAVLKGFDPQPDPPASREQ
jgi:hypothetical protein